MTTYTETFQRDQLADLFPLDTRDTELHMATTDGVYELARKLCHDAGSPDVTMPYAPSVYRLLGNLGAAGGALTTYTELLADRCRELGGGDEVRHEAHRNGEPDESRYAAVADLVHAAAELDAAVQSMQAWGDAVRRAQSALARVYHDIEPT